MHDSSVGTNCNEHSEKQVLYYKNILSPHLQESSVKGIKNGNGELAEDKT